MPTASITTGLRQGVPTLLVLLAGVLVLAGSPRLLYTPSLRADDREIKPVKIVAERVDASKPAPTRERGPQWLDRAAEFFRHPVVNILLVAGGLIGLFFELKLPGATLPGAVSAICFVLFFWSYSLVGEFTLLAILLFLLGLVFIGIEVFVLPGITFNGVIGAVLVIGSLLLVTLKSWPDSADDWTELGSTFGTLSIGLVLAVAGGFALAWSLPSIPVLNRIVLTPPSDEDEVASTSPLLKSGPVELLGAIGMTVTPLRPSGKAQFGGEFLDVIAEDYVPPGCRVQVVELEGMRIVVKEV